MAIVRIVSNNPITRGVIYEYDPDKDLLGKGGTADVYRGVQISVSGIRSDVAIKKLHPELPPQAVKRAKREATIQVKNDNLVKMIDSLAIEMYDNNGALCVCHYVICELLLGVTLADILHKDFRFSNVDISDNVKETAYLLQNRNDEIALVIMRKVLMGLIALHDAGYIHRDIDPSNIMITKDNRIVLIDFGIARPISKLKSTEEHLTKNGEFIGKIQYAAPELILGQLSEQGTHTDVYALGIMLYELLVGHVPFQGTGVDVMQSHLKKSPNLSVIKSPGLKRIIAKSLQKDPKKRYASAVEMLVDLQNYSSKKEFLSRQNHIFGFVVLCIVSIICVMFYVMCIKKKGQNILLSDDEMYNNAIEQLQSEATFQKGFDTIDSLASCGMYEAKYKLAYIYLWTPNDYQNNLYKQRIGIELVKEGGYIGKPLDDAVNKKAATLLQEVIRATDSTHMEALYYMGCCYANGVGISQDIAKAHSLFDKVRTLSVQNGDAKMFDKAEKGLRSIEDKD